MVRDSEVFLELDVPPSKNLLERTELRKAMRSKLEASQAKQRALSSLARQKSARKTSRHQEPSKNESVVQALIAKNLLHLEEIKK